MYTIQDLFDLDHTLAKEYLQQFTYPWEALKGIKDMILELGKTLDPEEYEEIRELAGACQVPVIFAGQLTQTKLADLYRRSDVFVLPSLNEGLPLSVIEALACGMRVVMNDLPGIRAWFEAVLPGNDIAFIPLPATDDLTDYQDQLADAIIDATISPRRAAPDLSHLTLSSLATRILDILS